MTDTLDILERLTNTHLHPSRCGPDAYDAAVLIRTLRAEVSTLKAIIKRMHVESNPYYIQGYSQCVGNEALWWKTDGHGYTTHLSKAGKFTKEDADAIHNNRAEDVPWPVDMVEDISHRTVDINTLRKLKKGSWS